jgi:mannitol-1-phosphate 5-dehydrogenase
MKKLLLFGAGKIGRSFVGQLFSRGGYEVIFIDINRGVIDQLNLLRSYDVIIKSDLGNEIIHINNVSGLHFSQTEEIMGEIRSTTLIATSVGPANLSQVLDILAGD